MGAGALMARLADACNPRIPGCKPETLHGYGILVPLLVAVIVLVAVALLVVYLTRRRRRASPSSWGVAGPSGASGAGVPASAPAGWFPDPAGRSAWRRWDGATWTDQVSGDGPPPLRDQ